MNIINPIFLGIIAALGALVLEIIFSIFISGPLPQNIVPSFFMVIASVVIEEAMKLIFIYKKFFQEKLMENIVLNSIFFGFGFSAVEVFFYLSKSSLSDINVSAVLPMAGIMLVQTLTSAIAGFILSQKRSGSYAILVSILFLNIIIHFSYNWLVIRYF